jgi:hypothetical protein
MKTMMNKRSWLKACCTAMAATLVIALASPALALEKGAERLVGKTRDAQAGPSCKAACSNAGAPGAACARAKCTCAKCECSPCKCGDCKCADCKCSKGADKKPAKPCCP